MSNYGNAGLSAVAAVNPEVAATDSVGCIPAESMTQPLAKAWNFQKGKKKRRARTFRSRKQPTSCRPNPAEPSTGIVSPVEGEGPAPVFIPISSRARGNEKWMLKRSINRLSSKLAKVQSKHEAKTVNAQREMVRLALQKKKVEKMVEQERANRLLAQNAKQESEGVAQSEKMLRLEAEKKGSKAISDLKEATHQHWRERKVQRELLLATKEVAKERMTKVDTLTACASFTKVMAVNAEVQAKISSTLLSSG